jgi:hypothetical protein
VPQKSESRDVVAGSNPGLETSHIVGSRESRQDFEINFIRPYPYHVSSSFSFHDATAPRRPGPPHYRGFTIILSYTHHTFGRTPLDE